MIRYTGKNKQIMSFVEEYGFITSKICANLFYKNNKSRVEQARHKMKILVDNGILVANPQGFGKELVYQFKKSKISEHKYYLLNLYSEINLLTNEIEYFKMEETWKKSKRRSDAHIIFWSTDINTGEELMGAYLIEFDKFHKTDCNKYNDIYNTGEVQDWYQQRYGESIFPNVMIINYTGKIGFKSDNFRLVGIDYNFTGLNQVL